MELDLGQKSISFYHSRKKLETNRFEYNAKITDYKSAKDWPAKFEMYMEKSSNGLQQIIGKNDAYIFAYAQPKRNWNHKQTCVFYLGSITAKNQDVLDLEKILRN